jgi:hypothetical protein
LSVGDTIADQTDQSVCQVARHGRPVGLAKSSGGIDQSRRNVP